MTPRLLVARWSTHDLDGEDMPGIAADLLERGYDSPSLRRLAGEMLVSSRADIEGLVEKMFGELGVDHPVGEKEAKLITSRQVAREVIAGKRNIWEAASHLEIGVCGWAAATPELQIIFSINDEIHWDSAYRRPLDEMESDLFDAFAALAIST